MTKTQFLAWFAQWKDVITTSVAVLAIAVVVIQIIQSGRFERARIKRQQEAARSTLPLTLAALSDYGQRMITALAPLVLWLERGEMASAPTFDGPRLPPETIAAVEKVIAAYPGQHVARALAAALGEVQVLQTRCRDFGFDESSIRSWSIAMKDNVVMAASVVARCEDLFDFARKGTDYAEPSRQHLQQVLSLSKIRQHQFPRIWEATEGYPEASSTLRQNRVYIILNSIRKVIFR